MRPVRAHAQFHCGIHSTLVAAAASATADADANAATSTPTFQPVHLPPTPMLSVRLLAEGVVLAPFFCRLLMLFCH